jgi:hypothetical protein
MSFQYLSEVQRARYRRFLTDPSPEDLERFFYLDAVALAEVAKKRGHVTGTDGLSLAAAGGPDRSSAPASGLGSRPVA